MLRPCLLQTTLWWQLFLCKKQSKGQSKDKGKFQTAYQRIFRRLCVQFSVLNFWKTANVTLLCGSCFYLLYWGALISFDSNLFLIKEKASLNVNTGEILNALRAYFKNSLFNIIRGWNFRKAFWWLFRIYLPYINGKFI